MATARFDFQKKEFWSYLKCIKITVQLILFILIKQISLTSETSLKKFNILYNENKNIELIISNISSFFALCQMKNEDIVKQTLSKMKAKIPKIPKIPKIHKIHKIL